MEIFDILVSIIVLIFVTLLSGKILSILKFEHLYFINHTAGIIGTLSAIFILHKNYPLTFFQKIKANQILKHVLPAMFIALIFTSFPYYLWLNHSKYIPVEYSLFVGFNLTEKFFFLFNLCLIGPFVEEVFFRGFLYRILTNRFNIFWGTIASTSLFYLAHGTNAPFTIVIASLIYTYVYQKTGNIWNSILTHSVNNTLWFVFMYWGIKHYQ